MANNMSTTWCPINATVTDGFGDEIVKPETTSCPINGTVRNGTDNETVEPMNGYVAHSIIYVVTLGTICVVGIFGNILVILCFMVEKKLRTISNLLIGFLAFVDFLNCSIYLPVHLLGGQIGLTPVICNIISFVNPLFPILSLHTQLVISVNRYMLVTKPLVVYRYWFSGTRTVLFTGLLQGLDMIILYFVPGFLSGWKLKNEALGFCVFDVEFEYYIMLTGAVYGSVLSFVSSFCLYAKLLWFVRKGPATVVSTKRKDIKLSLLLFIILLLFFVSFIIAPMLLFFAFLFVSNPWIYQILWSAAFCVIWMNVCINPILYGFRIRDFKRVYKKILCPCRGHFGNNLIGVEPKTN